jgi:polyisoprenoid-binding protein YceI
MMRRCTIDPDHSVATFAIRHPTIANVRGMFPKITGVVRYDDQEVTRSSVEAEIKVLSLSTGVRKRDEHVLSSEMLDAARYPTMTFRSTRIERKAGHALDVHGELTIHGVTRLVVFAAEHFGPVKSPWGGEVSLGFICGGAIDREAFGVAWGSDPLDGGGFVASRSVEISRRIGNFPFVCRQSPYPETAPDSHPFSDILNAREGGETGMKKTVSQQALAKEAALWEKMKEAVRKHPATACHK